MVFLYSIAYRDRQQPALRDEETRLDGDESAHKSTTSEEAMAVRCNNATVRFRNGREDVWPAAEQD